MNVHVFNNLRFSCVLADDATKELAVDILNDIDWCLDQLEGMQTHRSVSDMTTNKVSRAAIGHGSNRLATK